MTEAAADDQAGEKSDVESVERVIAAPPEKIFALLADPEQHKVIDGSGTVRDAKGESQQLQLGSKFGMKMKMGLPYSMESEVIEYEVNRCIAWQTRPHGIGKHLGGGRIWRYDLEPVAGGTRVRESWDISQEKGTKWLVGLDGARKRTRESMTKTLENIERITTS
jgi:uncharacterized protein YndB with AHSA1/START domain